VKIRGKPRNQGEAKTCEITRRRGRWYASVTVESTPERRHGAVAAHLDWGVETLATLALDTGEKIEVENPLRRSPETSHFCSREPGQIESSSW